MALIVKDRVQELTTTTGTGTLTLNGAVTGFQTFSSAIGNTNTTYYAISSNGSEFEVGIGTVGAVTLARTTILASSNGGSVVDLSEGSKTVFVTYPASKSVNLDSSNNLNLNGSDLNLNGSDLNLSSGNLNIDSNTLFVDSSTNKVGIGTDTPTNNLSVYGTAGDTRIRLEDTTGFTSLDMVAADGSNNVINFGDASDIDIGRIEYDHTANAMFIKTNDTEQIRITSAGGVSFGSSGTAYGTANQVLQSNGDATPTWIDNVSEINEVDLTSGSTYTVPSNLLYASITVVGGGGGGGSGDCTDSAASNAGAGGGGGGTSLKFFTKAEIGTSVTYAIGAGGAGGPGNAASTGTTGGTTTFTPNGTGSAVSVTGGAGGVGVSSGATSNSAAGGSGGVGSGGDIDLKGADGSPGISYSTDAIGGNGGGSYFGGGGAGATRQATGASPGVTATSFGAGGGGGASLNSTATTNGGGDGANGIIHITEYLA
jgi:hypothetical protein